jgi:hypothetical protein
MDVSKLPPAGLPAQPANMGTTTTAGTTTAGTAKEQVAGAVAAIETQDLKVLTQVVAAGDRADIRPLDVPGGLQILLAEIRTSLGFSAEWVGDPGESTPQGVTQAAHQIVQWMLLALPESADDVPAWIAALTRLEGGLQAGLQQAVDAVTAWRDVPVAVVDAVKQSGNLALLVLGDDQPNPLWLRPEWLGLAPRLERFRRRRRALRRGLTDPDHWRGSLDDNDEQRS